jgi:hypothetical protein
MHKTKRFTLFLIASGVLHGGPLNVGFENGSLSAWSTIGNATVTSASFGAGPLLGSFSGLLTDGPGSVPIATLESFLGLPPGEITLRSDVAVTEGSGMTQTFTANAGDQLTFPFLQLTNEPSTFADHETFYLRFSGPMIGIVSVGGSPMYMSAPASTGFLFVQKGSFCVCNIPPLKANGTYTVTFAVADDGTQGVKSGLMVDGTYAAVPEPSTFLAAGFGLFLLILPRIKRPQHR